MSTVSRGTEVELMIAAELTKKGFGVSFPLNHSSQYDLIVDVNNQLLRIQAKRAYIHSKARPSTLCVESRRILVKHSGKKGSVTRRYSENGYDFLIACDVDTNQYWVIPFNETRRYKAQIYLTTRFMIPFKNQWSLLGIDVSS